MKSQAVPEFNSYEALRKKIASLRIWHQETSEYPDAMQRERYLALADSTCSAQKVLELEKECTELMCRCDQINSVLARLSTEQAEVSAGLEATVHAIARLSLSLGKSFACAESRCPPGRIVATIPVEYSWALEYDLSRSFLIHLSRQIRLTRFLATSEDRDNLFSIDLSKLFEAEDFGDDARDHHSLGEGENNFLILLQIANTMTPGQKSLIFDPLITHCSPVLSDELTTVEFELKLY
jgi:hypothetical protein